MNVSSIRRTVCCLALAAASWTGSAGAVPPTVGEATSGVLPSQPVIDQYRAHGFEVWLSGDTEGFPGAIRLEGGASRRTVTGDIATERYEFIECTCGGYTFDPFAWTADIDTTVRTEVYITKSRIYPNHREQPIAGTRRTGTARIRLHWVGYGKAETRPVVATGIIYTIPVLYVDAGMWRTRPAHVNGVIRFGGLGILARTPHNAHGTLGYGLVVGD